MRARDDRTPVLVLTARDSLASRVGLLREGADDFLPKPFVLEELEARLLALIRRSRGREFQRMSYGVPHRRTRGIRSGSRHLLLAGR